MTVERFYYFIIHFDDEGKRKNKIVAWSISKFVYSKQNFKETILNNFKYMGVDNENSLRRQERDGDKLSSEKRIIFLKDEEQ